MTNKIIAIVGLCGSGKSEVSHTLLAKGFTYIRFGQLTIDELEKRGLEINEANERQVREELREKQGKEAYARLNIPKIDEAIRKNNVVIDGLYSWEEYLVLREKYSNSLEVWATYTPKNLRYERLSKRTERPLTKEEIDSRDKAEIENLNKGGPIAIADYTIINDASLDVLKKKVEELL